MTDNRNKPHDAGPVYRAYQIGEDDRVVSSEILDAASDEEALCLLRQRVDGLAVELWDRGRLVARVSRRDDSR